MGSGTSRGFSSGPFRTKLRDQGSAQERSLRLGESRRNLISKNSLVIDARTRGRDKQWLAYDDLPPRSATSSITTVSPFRG